MFHLLILLFVSLQTALSDKVGLCDLNTLPKTWTYLSAIGVPKVAHRGVPLGGVNYCIEQDSSDDTVKIVYHLNDTKDSTERKEVISVHEPAGIFDANDSGTNPNNYCIVKDPRVLYCIPSCSEEWQPQVIDAALQSSSSEKVADILNEEFGKPGWAISVLAVDYNNPRTHLNVSGWMDYSIWCSVYVGIKPKLGFDYLYEIQMGKVIV